MTLLKTYLEFVQEEVDPFGSTVPDKDEEKSPTKKPTPKNPSTSSKEDTGGKKTWSDTLKKFYAKHKRKIGIVAGMAATGSAVYLANRKYGKKGEPTPTPKNAPTPTPKNTPAAKKEAPKTTVKKSTELSFNDKRLIAKKKLDDMSKKQKKENPSMLDNYENWNKKRKEKYTDEKNKKIEKYGKSGAVLGKAFKNYTKKISGK